MTTTRLRPGPTLGLLILLAALVIAALAAARPASGATADISITVDTIKRTDQASNIVPLAGPIAVDDDLVGCTADVVVTGVNQDSVHPNSDIFVGDANSSTWVYDVERAIDVVTNGANQITLGETFYLGVHIGADLVFSGGVRVDIFCQPDNTTTVPTTVPVTTVPVTTVPVTTVPPCPYNPELPPDSPDCVPPTTVPPTTVAPDLPEIVFDHDTYCIEPDKWGATATVEVTDPGIYTSYSVNTGPLTPVGEITTYETVDDLGSGGYRTALVVSWYPNGPQDVIMGFVDVSEPEDCDGSPTTTVATPTTTVPDRPLPNTGNNNAAALIAVALIGGGIALVAATRRRHT